MSLSLDIETHQAIALPDGKYFFVKELPDDTLLLQSLATNASLALTERQLVTMLSHGVARLIDPPVRRRGNDLDPDKFSPVIPPNISEQKLREAEVIQKFIILSDRSNPPERRARKYWIAFVAAYRNRAIGRGSDPGVTAWQVERCWKKVEDTDNRHLSIFISQRGLGPRRRLSPEEEGLYDRVTTHFYSARGNTYRMAKDKFDGGILEANNERKRLGQPLLTSPEGETTLRKKIKAERTPENVKRKTSKREADAEFNGTNPALESQIPFEYVALDFTRLDVFVVDDESGMLLGRPSLGTGIEVASRAIAGVLLTFEDPSISTILTLIKKCMLPKYYVEEMLPDVVDRIDTFGKPYNIIIDRGLENLSDGLRHSCGQIGIDIRWAPRKTGQGKTWVERLFGTLNTTTFHPLPGSIPHHPALMRRLDLDPTKTAVITMSSLIELLHRNWINYENRTHSGVDEAPARRLRRFFKIHKRPMLADISVIDTLIGDTARGTLGTDGIHFKGMHFQNRNATTEIRSIMVGEQGKTKKSSKAKVKIQIKYNPDDASIIYIPFLKDGRWIYAKFFNRMNRFISSLSFSLEAKIRRFAKDRNLAYENEEHRIQARAAYVEMVELLSQLKGAAGKEVEKKVLAQLPRLKGELYQDYSEANLDDEDVKLVEPPFADSSQTGVRGRGIRRGRAKAAATLKHNKKVRQKIAQFDAKTSGEQGVRADTLQAPLGISFGSGNSAK